MNTTNFTCGHSFTYKANAYEESGIVRESDSKCPKCRPVRKYRYRRNVHNR